MSVITLAERETYALPATGPDYQEARVRVAPYVDVREAGDLVVEVLVHEFVSSFGNVYGSAFLFEASVELRAVSCAPHDPETLFEGGVVATASFVNSSSGSVVVAVPSGEWGDAVAVYVVLRMVVLTPG
jgi:hypothetical protein